MLKPTDITIASCYCKADKIAKDTVSSLNKLYGDSIKGLAPTLGGNSFFWFGDQYAYVINSEGSLDDVVNGEKQYVFIVSPNNTNSTNESTPSPQPIREELLDYFVDKIYIDDDGRLSFILKLRSKYGVELRPMTPDEIIDYSGFTRFDTFVNSSTPETR